jgi:hypothetical protein
MTHLDEPSDLEDVGEDIVQWQPKHGPLIGGGHMDGTVVIAATVGALAMLGLTAGAFLAGRASGRRA